MKINNEIVTSQTEAYGENKQGNLFKKPSQNMVCLALSTSVIFAQCQQRKDRRIVPSVTSPLQPKSQIAGFTTL